MRNVLLTLIFLIPPLLHAEVYKWTDENGQVHFTDRPRQAKSDQVEEVKIHSTNQAGISHDRKAKREKLLDVFQEEREDAAAEKMTLREKRKERERRCEEAQKNLKTYQEAGYLFRLDADGEKVVLDDTEHHKAMQKAREDVDAWCG